VARSTLVSCPVSVVIFFLPGFVLVVWLGWGMAMGFAGVGGEESGDGRTGAAVLARSRTALFWQDLTCLGLTH